MSDYIACVQASGGNKERIRTDIIAAETEQTTGSVRVNVGSSAGAALTRKSEKSIAERSETTWFPSGMTKCSEHAKALLNLSNQALLCRSKDYEPYTWKTAFIVSREPKLPDIPGNAHPVCHEIHLSVRRLQGWRWDYREFRKSEQNAARTAYGDALLNEANKELGKLSARLEQLRELEKAQD